MGGLDWALDIEKIDQMYPPGEIVRACSVDGDDNFSGAGESWDRPFATIQAALNKIRFEDDGVTIADAKNHLAKVAIRQGQYNEQVLFSGYGIELIGGGVHVPGKDYGVSVNYDGAIVAAPSVMAFSGSAITIKNIHIHQVGAYPALYCAGGDNNLLENIVIEGDDTNMTIAIQMASMKGSWIRKCVLTRFTEDGIFVSGGDEKYFIWGGIEDNLVSSGVSNVNGIRVAAAGSLVAYGSVIRRNDVILYNGSSCKGIDVNNTGSVLVRENFVSVPASATPIEHAGGDQFMAGNKTAAGTVNADPFPTAA